MGIIEGEDNVEGLVDKTVGRAVEGNDKLSKGREQTVELTGIHQGRNRRNRCVGKNIQERGRNT